jgi:hypothetical protein
MTQATAQASISGDSCDLGEQQWKDVNYYPPNVETTSFGPWHPDHHQLNYHVVCWHRSLQLSLFWQQFPPNPPVESTAILFFRETNPENC